MVRIFGPLFLVFASLLVACVAGSPQRGDHGWEGFYAPSQVTAGWLRGKGMGLPSPPLERLWPRVGKLVVVGAERRASRTQLERRHRDYCASARARAWNEALCAALEARRCDTQGRCTYRHVGNCSGLLQAGRFLTAAHCLVSLSRDAEAKGASHVLLPGTPGVKPRRLALGRVVLGKRDFARHWVSAEARPLDVASVSLLGAGGAPVSSKAPPVKVGPVPPRGALTFLLGFPRAERRSVEARRRHGYGLTFGTPAVTFGRVVDSNRGRLPFCSVDGKQEHWQLAARCPRPPRKVDVGYVGVITEEPFLSSYDNINGFSGGPVFDAKGRLVGINVTVAGGIDPQERYSPQSRAVAVGAEAAIAHLRRLGGSSRKTP